LWHSLTLPKLSADEALSATELEVKSLNPFSPEDLVWSHTALVATSGVSKVQIVIASRKIVAQHITSLESTSTNHEVWVKLPESPNCIVLDGFGEKIRRQRSARWRILNFCLVFLLMVTGFSAALTPSAQLYFRSTQAAKAYEQLRSVAAPAMQQRELLVKLDGQVTALRGQLARSIKPELVLLRITQILNDDTYVTQIQTRDNKILLTGQTPNTAALMQQLGTQAGVTDVRAPTAAVKQRGSERETFNIEFTLDPSSLMPPQ
jgi:general secretion pathway protein L